MRGMLAVTRRKEPRQGWLTMLVTHGRDLTGRSARVVAGVYAVGGKREVAVAVETSKPVRVSDDDVRKLITSLNTALEERAR